MTPTRITQSAVVAGLLSLLAAGCGGSLNAKPDGGASPEPYTLTFALQNSGTSSVYLYENCILDLTLTELAAPTKVIGRSDGCAVCDCAAASCPQIACGVCLAGSIEVAAASQLSYYWSAVDQTSGTHGTSACVTIRVLPAGQYRIDVPVYGSMSDAAARTNARIVSQTFALPPSGDIAVGLAVSP